MLLTQEPVSPEEVAALEAVRSAPGPRGERGGECAWEVRTLWLGTLYERASLPFVLSDLPQDFASYRKALESASGWRAQVPLALPPPRLPSPPLPPTLQN